MKQIYKIGIAMVAICMFAIGAYSLSAPAAVQTNEQPITITPSVESLTLASAPPDNGASVKYKGHVTIYKTEALTGITTKVADKDNLLVTNGITYIRNQIGSGTSQASNWTGAISLSDSASSPAVGWTVIPNEITNTNATNLSRHLGTYSANGTTGYNVTYTWTASATHNNVQLTGLSFTNVSGANTLFAALTFTPQSLLVSDTLNIIWQITIG